MLSDQGRALASKQLAHFVSQFGTMTLFSTGARAVTFTEPLYNITGSTDDPTIDGLNWRKLLLAHGISGNCYADTPAAPAGKSHPAFNVGGHMTDHPDGKVPVGGTAYLMPLCSWHNSTSKNGKAFHHAQTRVLELSGFMQGEPAATFMARMDGALPYTVVYVGEEGLTFRNLADVSGSATLHELGPGTGQDPVTSDFVLLRRRDGAGDYVIENASF